MEAILSKSEYEIERGKPMPNRRHAVIQMKIGYILLSKYPHYFALPELSILIKDHALVPDLAIYKVKDFDHKKEEIRATQIPLGVVEILSPKQNMGDLIIKTQKYFKVGIQSYWLVIPALEAIFVFSDTNEYEVYKKKETLKDDALKIEIALTKIFD